MSSTRSSTQHIEPRSHRCNRCLVSEILSNWHSHARFLGMIVGCLLTFNWAYAGTPTYWIQAGGYQIEFVRPGGDRPCTLFMLVGVNNSDPVMPGTRYFAISNTAPEYQIMVATLLAAKLSGRGITVVTTGQVDTSCGHPSVSVLELP